MERAEQPGGTLEYLVVRQPEVLEVLQTDKGLVVDVEEDAAPLVVVALKAETLQVREANKGAGRESSDLAVSDLQVVEGRQTPEVVGADVGLQEEFVLTDQLQPAGSGQVRLVLQAEVLVVVQAPEEYRDKTMKHFGTAGWQGKFKANKIIKKKAADGDKRRGGWVDVGGIL